MATSIRLMRTGSHKSPRYRVVVKDSRTKRDGRFIEILGHYNPCSEPIEFKINEERLRARVAHGARISETVKGLVRRSGIDIHSAPKAES